MSKGSSSYRQQEYQPNPGGGGGGKGDDENVLGPRIPATLDEALGDKGRAMSIDRAMTGTNPHYSEEYDAYRSNCQRCVLAYEARRRGYDVTALPTYSGDMLPYSGDYLKALSSPKTISVGASNSKGVVKNIESNMSQFGPRSRAIVHVNKGHEGHVFIVENVSGKLEYIDPQTKKRSSSVSFSRVNVHNVRITRLDDQQFTDYARNAFTRQRI